MPDPYREPIEENPQPETPAAPTTGSAEEEILELERQLAAKKAALNKEKPIEQAISKEMPTASTSAPTAPAAPPAIKVPAMQAAIKEDAAKFKGVEKNQQLKALVDMAFLKGVNYAIEVARNLDNPFLMDEFHDVLIDEFRQKLVEGGKLEEI